MPITENDAETFLEILSKQSEQKKLNKITKQALNQSKLGKNLKKFNSLDDLFDDLGI